MSYETASRIIRMNTPEQSYKCAYYKSRSNTELQRLVDARIEAQRADPDELYKLRMARARLRNTIRNTEGEHLNDMLLMRELNARIWELDKKDHIRAMAMRRISH